MNHAARFTFLALISAGLSACMTTVDKRADLVDLFKEQLRACYTVPLDAKGGEPTIVEVRLNADGALAQAPKVMRGNPGSIQAKAALRAVKRCAPFRIPAEIVPRHAQWKVMMIGFDTN